MRTTHRHLVRAAVLLALLTVPAFAQAPGEADPMVANFDEKMAKEFVKNAAWVMDYGKAKEQAAKDGKLIFAYFTRSYAP